jgi:hypothetical protein
MSSNDVFTFREIYPFISIIEMNLRDHFQRCQSIDFEETIKIMIDREEELFAPLRRDILIELISIKRK